jgi:hypothetical protein
VSGTEIEKPNGIPRRAALECLGLGAALAIPFLLLEHRVFEGRSGQADLRLDDWGSVMLSLFLFAPVQEGAELVATLLPFRKKRAAISFRSLGAFRAARLAAASAAGFAIVRVAGYLASAPHDMGAWGRAALLIPTQLFCAAMWGYALGEAGARAQAGSPRKGNATVGIVVAVAILLHGLYDHLVLAREVAGLLGAAPLLVGMILVAWAAIRDASPAEAREAGLDVLPLRSLRAAPPSFKAVRKALRRAERPIMLRWALVGALVTTGLTLSTVALTIGVARRLGVDFSAVDQADAASTLPLALLGAAGLFSFPVSGYLVARASAAESVLESAISAGLCIVGMLVLLGIASPVGLVFSLAVAPIAFALACSGAWLAIGS